MVRAVKRVSAYGRRHGVCRRVSSTGSILVLIPPDRVDTVVRLFVCGIKALWRKNRATPPFPGGSPEVYLLTHRRNGGQLRWSMRITPTGRSIRDTTEQP